MKVKFSPRAKRRVATIKQWWLANRPAVPDLFDQELAEAIRTLSTTPMVGTIHGTVRNKLVLRLLLPKTEQHVYYSEDKDAGVVGVITLWGARRGRLPKL